MREGSIDSCDLSFSLQMRISYDDRFLFSVGLDGSLLAFRVSDKEGRGIKAEKDVGYAEEVLVTRTDLEEKVWMALGTLSSLTSLVLLAHW